MARSRRRTQLEGLHQYLISSGLSTKAFPDRSSRRPISWKGPTRLPGGSTSWAPILATSALALVGSGIAVHQQAQQAERQHPPKGRFVTSGNVRLHYIEKGSGPPLILLHGNGATVDDFLIAGVLDQASRHFRVIAFDRPGFGYSERPRDRAWTPAQQAALLPQAFARLGIEPPIIVGHSWGALVALALALDEPAHVAGLALASGYYFPELRTDVALFAPPAIPVIGDILSHTIAPPIGRAIAPALLRKMFWPRPVPENFSRQFPMGLALRPSQIRAFSEDSAQMTAQAAALAPRYGSLSMPVRIISGDEDQIVGIDQHARRLATRLPHSMLDVVAGAGHMVHHAAPEKIVRAAESLGPSPRRPVVRTAQATRA